MTSNRFFIEKLNLDSFPNVYLSGNEHHHLSRVARVKPYEKVWLFDGQGMNYLARVEEISPERTRLVILETAAAEEPKVKMTLGQALLKDILLFYSQEDEAKIPSSVIILVGPEGGWTQKEEEIMLSHGYEAVSLGKSVLGAETAAISAVALVSHFWLY